MTMNKDKFTIEVDSISVKDSGLPNVVEVVLLQKHSDLYNKDRPLPWFHVTLFMHTSEVKQWIDNTFPNTPVQYEDDKNNQLFRSNNFSDVNSKNLNDFVDDFRKKKQER